METPFDASWRKRHIWQHVIGGVIWYLILLAPPFGSLDPWWRVYWATVIQGIWERYQREYEPTYPVWSMLGDTLCASFGATLCAIIQKIV
jgi:hypothetical protein